MDDQFCFDDSPDAVLLRKRFEAVQKRLKDLVPRAQYEKFIRPLHIRGKEAHVVALLAPGKFLQVWVQDKYKALLEKELSEVFGEPVEVYVEASLHTREEAPTEDEGVFTPAIADAMAEQYNFNNFVPGPTNELAYNAARLVAEQPGDLCNPFFLHGKTGLGKTHLLCAIQYELNRTNPKANVRYQTGHAFTTGFLAALERGATTQFKKTVESSLVWLVDDVQFLDGKVRTQEEFFHLFNQLIHAGKQVVICADRAPRDLNRFEERLRSRLESGVVAEILPPDTETRLAIVRMRSEELGMSLPDDVCEYLAYNVAGSVRTLIGAVKTFIATAKLTRCRPDVSLAARTLDQRFGSDPRQTLNAANIIQAVAAYCSVSEEDLRSSSRKAWVTRARHVAVYLVREITGESWKRIGERLGNRDHSSIIHGYERISSNLSKDSDLKRDVGALRRTLGAD